MASRGESHLKDGDPLGGRPTDPFCLARVSDQLFLIPRGKVLVVFRPRELTVQLVAGDLEGEAASSGDEVAWVISTPPRRARRAGRSSTAGSLPPGPGA